jgi:hypothetical protein
MNMKLGLLNETKHENQKAFHDVHLGGLLALKQFFDLLEHRM